MTLTEFRSSSNHEMSDRRIARKLNERSLPVKASEARKGEVIAQSVGGSPARKIKKGRTSSKGVVLKSHRRGGQNCHDEEPKPGPVALVSEHGKVSLTEVGNGLPIKNSERGIAEEGEVVEVQQGSGEGFGQTLVVAGEGLGRVIEEQVGVIAAIRGRQDEELTRSQ